jgi:hypothetical protein
MFTEAPGPVERGSQQIVTIRADDLGQRLAGGQAPEQAVLLDPDTITLQPVRTRLTPVGSSI